MRGNNTNVIETYQNLKDKRNRFYSQMVNLQRKKDYEINCIDSKYSDKISFVYDKIQALDIEIKNVEEFIHAPTELEKIQAIKKK